MNKKIVRADLAEDLYNSYSDKFGREEAAKIIDHIILKMKNEVADGNTIELRGFGTLYAKKETAERMHEIQRQAKQKTFHRIMWQLSKPDASLKTPCLFWMQ